jgi:hypothetical protein
MAQAPLLTVIFHGKIRHLSGERGGIDVSLPKDGHHVFIAPHARIVLSALAAQSGSANSGNPAVWIAPPARA